MSLKVSEPPSAVSDAVLKTTVAKPDFRSACGRVLDIRKGGRPHPLPRPPLTQTFTSPGGRFVIHYTTTGADAVYDASSTAQESVVVEGDPLAEVLAALDPSTGVPAYVQRIAFWLDLALTKYQEAWFPDPVTRNNLTDVHIWKLIVDGVEVRGRAGNGTIDLHKDMCASSADLVRARVQHTCCHELFHLVEDMLIFDSGGVQIVTFPDTRGAMAWMEGLAELAPDFVNRWQNTWMDHRDLLLPVTLDDQLHGGYSACLIWRYVCDRFSNMPKAASGSLFGVDIMRQILGLADKPNAVIDWDVLLGWMRGHPEARVTPPIHRPEPQPPRHPWEKEPPPFRRPIPEIPQLLACPLGADVYSDWLVANIVQDFENAGSTRRFGYADRKEAPGLPHSIAVGVTAHTLPVGLTAPAWGFRYYNLDLSQETGPVHLQITTAPMPGAPAAKPNLQIVKTDGARVVDIVRASGDLDTVIEKTYSGTATRFIDTPLKDVFLILAAEEAGVVYRITVA